MALRYGADHVINPKEGSLKEQIDKLTNGKGPSVVAECSGNDTAIASLFDIAGHSCRVSLIGHSIGRKVPVELGWTIWKTLGLKGAGGTKDFGQRTIKFMSAIKDKYDFDALNTHFFDFENLHEAMETAIHEKENAFKVMLKFNV